MYILGIESSCDETAIAIVEDGRKVIVNEVFSQALKHQEWGGVIPELASRMHLEVINDLLLAALNKAKLNLQNDIAAIAVTQGPGLIGPLMLGFNFAKTLAWLYQKPLIPINHLHGHVCANFIDSQLKPPFLCMLASGGHTQIIFLEDYTKMQIIGQTVDDAAGEAFDKVARLMQLSYPGGPELDKLAQTAQDSNITNQSYRFPVAELDGLNFSFSGLKTAVIRLREKIGEEIWQRDKSKIAKAFQDCVARTFVEKIQAAIEITNCQTIILAGGVAANSAIRKAFKEKFSSDNAYELQIPSLEYCTDNAAMIAAAGFFQYQAQPFNYAANDFNLEVFSRSAKFSK